MEKKEKRNLYCKLTDDDRVRLSNVQKGHYQESLKLQQQIDRLKAEQKPHEKQIEKIFSTLIAGEEERPVDCQWEYDWDRGQKTLFRLDTGEAVCDPQTIQEYEKQQRLRAV